MSIFNIGDLTAYPGVKVTNGDTAALVIELVNGLVGDVGPVGSKVADLSPVPARAKAIALKVAARALQNPENAESITTGLDDWKKTIRYRPDAINPDEAGVYLNDAETETLLKLVRPKPVRRVGTIRVAVPGHAFRS